MANTIDQVYIQTFERNLRQLAQQQRSRARPFVAERGTDGNKHNWERLGPTVAVQKTTRATPTPVSEAPWSRRTSIATTWHNGDLVEQEDPVQMLVDPNSNLSTNLSMSMARATDDIIFTAATGDALQGDGSTVAFPVGQKIDKTTVSITFDDVTAVQEKFLDNDIETDVPKVFFVSPAQVRKLMQLTEQTSSDYVRVALDQLAATGIVPNWMGFTWIMSTRLTNGGVSGDTACLAFTDRALGLQVNRDVSARVEEDPSVSFAWRVYCFMTMGAVRVEDEQIVWLQVGNTL